MQDRKRRIALFLCLGLIIALVASSAFIFHEANHDCTGEDCPVCQMIAVNLSVLRLSVIAVLTLMAIQALLNLFLLRHKADQPAYPFSNTLVNLKIRLND